MALNLIDRTIRVSWMVGAILFVFLTPSFPVSIIWSLSVGVFLSGLNFWILRGFFGSLFSPAFSKKKMIAYVGMKFPVFYGLFFLAVYWIPVSFEAFITGFLLPFIVMALKAVGQVFLAERSFFSMIRSER